MPIHQQFQSFLLLLLLATLLPQLEQLPGFLSKKDKIFCQYQAALNNIEGLTLAEVPGYADNNHWMNLLQIDSDVFGEDREAFMKRLEKNGIQTRPVWLLNHLQKPYMKCQSFEVERAKELVNISLCLPSSTNLSDEDLNYVISNLNG